MRQVSDTPAKSQPPVDDSNFALADHFTTEDLAFIWTTMCNVVKKANAQRTKNAPESQWCSFIVAPILDLLYQLHCYTDGKPQLEVLDISTTSIDPIDLCPYHENPEVWRILNKKVDFVIGLSIDYEQKRLLQIGTYEYPHPHKHGTSINQTSSWANYVPIFLNIEMKKNVSDDPMIQLGAWVAAEFKKRESEGYDISMPVFAIDIEEDIWNLHISYATGTSPNQLVFMGPESMGDTKSHQGVFKILHVLNGLVEWGNTEYRAWFEREVLPKHQTIQSSSAA
jgi:hypothetical protein